VDQAPELLVQALKPLYVHSRDSAFALNVLKKLRQFRMTAREGQAAEEEGVYSFHFPPLLTEILK
jgi:hypothetical protein